MAAGMVDIYFDSPFPTLAVEQLAGSEIILRRWKGGLSEYWSTFVARKDGEVEEVGDLLGEVVAFEEPRSTSGFVLPAGTLIQRGFTVIEVEGPDAEVRPDEIGYVFSRDEENTFEMVLSGKVTAGGVSNEDYEELSDEMMSQIVTLGQTIKVPRQLVSVRPGLDPQVVDRVRELLIGLDQTEEGMRLLLGLKTTKFDPFPTQEQASLRELRKIMG